MQAMNVAGLKETSLWNVNIYGRSPTFSPQPLRAWNNFPAAAGQVVRSNLFLLGHSPFLAGQISITSYLLNSPPTPPTPPKHTHTHDVYISNKYIFYAFIEHAVSNSMQETEVERTVQPQRSAKSILHLCTQLSLQFRVFNTVKF